MFNEVLVGYERDGRGRDALDIMLFDQYGNYGGYRFNDFRRNNWLV
jgi:hypothetical protein